MMTNPLLDLLFPRLCAVCGSRLQSDETHLCLHCLRHLPRTDFHKESEHAMEQLFRGKIDIDRAFAFFYSTPHSQYRRLLHHIKYHNGKECARYLGKLYAEELCETGLLDDIDLIIPVPLHRTRMRKRGYNQSEWIALGISDITGITLDTQSLIRPKANPSQTHLSLYERWLNTHNIFSLSPNHNCTDKHILLVDDIVTTGATLLACAQNKIIEKLQSLIKGLAAQLTQSGTPNIRLCDCLECHSSTLQENCVSVTGSYPVYGATGLIGYTNNYAYNGESILIVKDGSGVGSLSYVNDHFSVIGTLNYLTAKENYSILYLYYALMAFNFTPYITGMAIPHIYFKDYGKAKLFYPSIEKRIRIASLLHNIEQKLVVEQNLVISLSAQKSYLLRMLFI